MSNSPSPSPAGAPTVIQTKCYHPHSSLHPPQNTYPMSTFSPQQPQPPYPAPQLNGGPPSKNPDAGKTVDFTQPQDTSHNNKPKPPPRFTDWLQNESQQLKQRGHVYRVSNPSRLKSTNSVKKTVRFSEPSEEGEEGDNHRSSPRAVPNDYVDHTSLVVSKQGVNGAYNTADTVQQDNHTVNIPKESYHQQHSNTQHRIDLTDGTSGSNLQLNSLV